MGTEQPCNTANKHLGVKSLQGAVLICCCSLEVCSLQLSFCCHTVYDSVLNVKKMGSPPLGRG